MKIFYDNQIFSRQKFGGVSNYFVNLIKSLNGKIRFCVPITLSSNVYMSNIGLRSYGFLDKINFKGKNRLLYFINKIFNIFYLKLNDFDIVHPTYYDDYVLKYKKPNTKLIITVHDMIHEKYPEFFPKKSLEYRTKQRMCEHADKIIAISQTTKNDLISTFNVSKDKIDVVYHGTNFNVFTEGRNEIDWLPEQYVLFVGSRDGYKNFRWMLESIANVLRNKKLKLVIIGSPLNNVEISLARELKVESSLICRNVYRDIDLQYIYNNAIVFIFPSLYEGFGIPILEAFASKTPILLSDTSCFREIADDAALYFKVNDCSDFIEKINSLLCDCRLRGYLIEKGLIRLKNFSWEKCSRETFKTYESAMSNYK